MGDDMSAPVTESDEEFEDAEEIGAALGQAQEEDSVGEEEDSDLDQDLQQEVEAPAQILGGQQQVELEIAPREERKASRTQREKLNQQVSIFEMEVQPEVKNLPELLSSQITQSLQAVRTQPPAD